MKKLIIILLVVALVTANVFWLTANDDTRQSMVNYMFFIAGILIMGIMAIFGVLLGHKQATNRERDSKPRRQQHQLPYGQGQPPIIVLGGPQSNHSLSDTHEWEEYDDDSYTALPAPAPIDREHSEW